jgi:hypothetical protein
MDALPVLLQGKLQSLRGQFLPVGPIQWRMEDPVPDRHPEKRVQVRATQMSNTKYQHLKSQIPNSEFHPRAGGPNPSQPETNFPLLTVTLGDPNL